MDTTQWTLDGMRSDSDWCHGFALIGTPDVVGEPKCDGAAFTLGDVAEVLAAQEGDNDGPPWIAVLRLNDERFALVSAWCDLTGWGCQDGGSCAVASNLEQLVRFGLGDNERRRLGYTLEPATAAVEP